MNLAARLAYAQLTTNRRRTVWTLLGIVLSISMITAVYGFAFSGFETAYGLAGQFRDAYMRMFMITGFLLSLVIFSASVIVMSNAFRVSAAQRLAQFGILKSVGATKKQITKTILYEGLYLTVVAIPLGVVLGVAVQYVGLYIANTLLVEIGQQYPGQASLSIDFVLAWQAILIAVIIGVVTVLVSAYLPARKAAKIPAIDAILSQSENKIKNTRPRRHRLVMWLFGFEGALAAKSLRRSKRSYRATVISISISIVMFIAAGSFGTHLLRAADLVIFPLDVDVVVEWHSYLTFTAPDVEDDWQVEYHPLPPQTAEKITARLRGFSTETMESTPVIGSGSTAGRTRVTIGHVPVSTITDPFRAFADPYGEWGEEIGLQISLIAPDAQTYAELARRAGVPHGSNILVNFRRIQVEDRWTEFTPLHFTYQTLTLAHDEATPIPLHGQLRGDQVPNEILAGAANAIIIIVPELEAITYFWFVQTDDPWGIIDYVTEIVGDLFPPNFYNTYNVRVSSTNIAVINAGDREMFRLIMVFIYGFVGMLTLIGLTNVISTISTNIRTRRREFAILQSTGMTPEGLNRMLNLESLLCSLKSLIIGLPLGIGAAYAVYSAMLVAVHIPFIFPFLEVLACIVAVFIITWVTMRFAASRLQKGNIVEAIRGRDM